MTGISTSLKFKQLLEQWHMAVIGRLLTPMQIISCEGPTLNGLRKYRTLF